MIGLAQCPMADRKRGQRRFRVISSLPRHATPSRSIYQRRGSTYMIVLFTSMIVAVVAFAGFQRMQVDQQTATMQRDWNDAAVLAASAVEFALVKLGNDHDWRTAYRDRVDGNYTTPIALGRGTIRWQLEDPDDGQIDNDAEDGVRIYGAGKIGQSERVFSVLAWPSGSPLDGLRSAVHAGGTLRIASSVDVRNGPATTNQDAQISAGTLLGDLEATSVDIPDQVVGTVTLLPRPKTRPSSVLFSVYQSLATVVPSSDLGSGSTLLLENRLVSRQEKPTPNSVANPDGVYLIQLGDYQTLEIRDCRIVGSLLIQMSRGSQLQIGPNVVWRAARADYPALLVDATSSDDSPVSISCSGKLVEANSGVNFNPVSVPYYGTFDSDLSDEYTASMLGLFHIIRDPAFQSFTSVTTIQASEKIRGCLWADGEVVIDAPSILAADPRLYANPPQGYSTFPDPSNLLINGDIENGLTGWSRLGANTSLDVEDDAHTGEAGLEIRDRDTASSGVQQDVTSRLVSGLPLTSEVWLKMSDSEEMVEITLELESTGEGLQRFVATAEASRQWGRVQVEHTPVWTGTLNHARWQVTTTTTTQDFELDDAIIHDPQNSPASTLVAVPGSWRAEALP